MTLVQVTQSMADFVWTVPAVFMLVGVGLYLSITTNWVQFRKFKTAVNLLTMEGGNNKKGEVSPLQALAVSLAGTVGAGNITGVASAIGIGGPGAIFWMWVTAILGMATTYSCCTLAVKYREQDKDGNYIGGPMYVLKNALNSPRLAIVFAVCTIFATIGSGNMIPANAIMGGISYIFPSAQSYTLTIGIVLAFLVGLVVVGGVKRIGQIMSAVVPGMCLIYLIAVLGILVLNYQLILPAFAKIFNEALNPWAIGGGALGRAIQVGVARGLFSNEAGQGSLPMIHALAKTENPEQQGLIAMLGPFIDTVIICTLTALVIIIMQGHVNHQTEGSQIAIYAFGQALGNLGVWTVGICLAFFAYSTIVAWAYYGEAAVKYLFDNVKLVTAYRVFYSAITVAGVCLQLELVWNICDLGMACMMMPNLYALLRLRGTIKDSVQNIKPTDVSQENQPICQSAR